MNTYIVSIYKPIKGWTAVVYGPDGPETTGPGHASPHGAYQDAIEMAREWNCPPPKPMTFAQDCERHPLEWTVNGKCDECHYEEFRARIQEMRHKHD